MTGSRFLPVLPVLALFIFGCTGQADAQDEQQAPDDLVGTWRIFGQTTSRMLELNSDGTWAFGSSGGSWHVEPISDADWQRWGLEPYGPVRKIVVENWDQTTAEGPVEESAIEGRPDFFWLFYKATVEGRSGDAQLKFGHGYD